uniref:PUM-HD domain-containing protein n=1 Tax=Syphacia muris TaxID=451379 RepID=A0A0N5A8J8_9BILA
MMKLKKLHKSSKKATSKSKNKKLVGMTVEQKEVKVNKLLEDTARRKRKLSFSESSLGSSNPPERKLKRVSFAEKLEHTKVFEKSVKKLKVEPSTASPGRSILSKKPGSKPQSSKIVEDTSDKSLSDEKKLSAIRKAHMEGGKRKKTLKLQVTRSLKEKLMSMTKKEKKLYLRELHRQKKPLLDLCLQCKKLWETARSSRCKAEEKEKANNELFALLKGKLKDVVYAHDMSRVVEYLFSCSQLRSAIFDELTPELIRMAKARYAHYVVAKMLKNGSPAQRNIIIDSFRGRCVPLMKMQFAAARILEIAYNEFANATQRWNIVSEFYGPDFVLFKDSNSDVSCLADVLKKDPARKTLIVGHLEKVLNDIIDKPHLKFSLTHLLLRNFFDYCSKEQRAEMIDSLQERVLEIIHTNDGAYVGLHCIWYGNAKERKFMVKNFKGYVVKAAQERFGHRVLLGIFDAVDDTVLVSKFIIQELTNNIRDVAFDPYGVKVLHYLISPRHYYYFKKGYVGIFEQGDNNEYSKKEAKDRYAQLFSNLSEALYTFFAGSMEDLLFSKTTANLVLNALHYSGENDLYKLVVKDEQRIACYEAIAKVCSEEFIPFNTERLHAIEHPNSHFVISQLLIADKDRPIKLSDYLAKLDSELLSSWVSCNKGCFVLLHMLETGSGETQKLLRKIITGKALQRYTTKGAVLLLKKLTS